MKKGLSFLSRVTVPKQTPLTNASFGEFIRLHEFVVVHFWAIWNNYDVQMKELIESHVPDDLSEVVAFASFDTDPEEYHEIVRQHRVLNLPFLAFYRDGLLVHSHTGAVTPEALARYLRQLVDPGKPKLSSN
jgi:thioredoxin-like negative regulator of GroEL